MVTGIQTEYVPVEEGSDLDDDCSAQAKSLDLRFPESNMRRTFGNDVQTALPDHLKQRQVQRTLIGSDDMTPHQDTAENA